MMETGLGLKDNWESCSWLEGTEDSSITEGRRIFIVCPRRKNAFSGSRKKENRPLVVQNVGSLVYTPVQIVGRNTFAKLQSRTPDQRPFLGCRNNFRGQVGPGVRPPLRDSDL